MNEETEAERRGVCIRRFSHRPPMLIRLLMPMRVRSDIFIFENSIQWLSHYYSYLNYILSLKWFECTQKRHSIEIESEGRRERDWKSPMKGKRRLKRKQSEYEKKTIKSFNLILGQENVLIKMKRRHIKPIISKWKWKRCDIFAYN